MGGAELGAFLRDDVFPYMASLVREDPHVAGYFRDSILQIAEPGVLKQVVEEIGSIEFRKLGPDVKGDIFEYLLCARPSSGKGEATERRYTKRTETLHRSPVGATPTRQRRASRPEPRVAWRAAMPVVKRTQGAVKQRY